MKYLKKIFEDFDYKSQYEEIEDYFLAFLENQTVDSEIFCEMEDADSSETYCIFRAWQQDETKFDSIEAFDDLLLFNEIKTNFLKKLKVSLKRLNQNGFNWEYEENPEQINILVFYKKGVEEDLELAIEPLLNAQKSIHESVLKRVLKKKYGLDLERVTFNPTTSGFYGKNSNFTLWFRNQVFDYEHQLYKDLYQIKEKNNNRQNIIDSFEVRLVQPNTTMLFIKLKI